MSSPPRVSIVLPCYNEGSRIASSLAALDSWFGAGVDVLVVDDGSGDDTVEQATRFAAARPHVRVHRLPSHRGKGGAVRAAIPLVRGDHVVFVDADLAFGRESLERALNGLASADMVVGNRRHEGSVYSVPVRLFRFLYRRHVMGLVFNAFLRPLVGVSFRDTQCGLKAFRRSSLDRIAPALAVDGFALDVEILLVAASLGLRIAEVPVHVRYESAKSSVRMIHSGWAMASDIVRIAVRRATGHYSPARLRALSETTSPGRRGN